MAVVVPRPLDIRRNSVATALAAARPRLRRAWPSIVTGGCAVVVLLMLAWRSGGYFQSAYLSAGSVALVALAAVFAIRPPHHTWSMPAIVAVAALAGYTLWTGISLAWTSAPVTGLEDMQRDLVYVALFGLGLAAAGSGRYARQLVWAALGVAVLVVGAGVVSRLLPELVHSAAPNGLDLYRLSYPLGYWNAFGALAALGGVLGIGLAADPSSPRVVRALSAGAAVLLATGMYLSFSRGAWLALACGLVVLAVLASYRLSLLLSAAIVAGLAAIAIRTLHAYPALVKDPAAGSGQAAQGRSYLWTLLACVAAAVALQGLVAAGRAAPLVMQALRRVIRPVMLAVVGVAAVLTLAFYLVNATKADRHGEAGIASVERYVSRQWHDFMHPTVFSQAGEARLTSAKGTRSELYRVALKGFSTHPLGGDGAGAYQYRFMAQRRVPETVRNAHSLYLETLDELGLVGLVLLAVFVGCLVAAAVRSRVRVGALGRTQTAAVAAACTVWIVHAGVDWDWQMPALTGTALILSAALFPYGRGRRPGGGLRRDTGLSEASRWYGAPAARAAGGGEPGGRPELQRDRAQAG